MNTQPAFYKHAALMISYANDPDQQAWFWCIDSNQWLCTYDPMWHDDRIYVLGAKPTSPPTKMCKLGGLEFPMPETVAPPISTRYYCACLTGIKKFIWRGDAFDEDFLSSGVVHLTLKKATAHYLALMVVTRQSIKDAQ